MRESMIEQVFNTEQRYLERESRLRERERAIGRAMERAVEREFQRELQMSERSVDTSRESSKEKLEIYSLKVNSFLEGKNLKTGSSNRAQGRENSRESSKTFIRRRRSKPCPVGASCFLIGLMSIP